MKKSKAFLSFFSILMCAALMFTVFSSAAFKNSAVADVKLSGVSGKLYKFGESIIDAIYDEEKVVPIEPKTETANQEKVRLGGYPVGLKLYADGVVVVGTESVDTAQGEVNTAEDAGLKIGDIIKKVNGNKVETNSEVSKYIENSNGEELHFEILREQEILNITFKGAFSVSENRYKAGIWIRDSSAGIGTVTFCTEDGFFASLGHAVCDIDTKKVLPISQGECTDVNITGFVKGNSGTTGELCGFLENESNGNIYCNGDIGVYGEFEVIPQGESYLIAERSEAVTGEASIFTTLENGVMTEYKVEIVSIDMNSSDNKNLVLKIKDYDLIEKTGGIIQGMSGSPIVQNGKIIGAVTHVFLNDPTGGYGIFAETMLENIQEIKKQQALQKAS